MAKVIYGTSGDDFINNQDSNVSINGGAGSDNIGIGTNTSKVTVTGGKGNDFITSMTKTGVLYEYATGDGIDYISGFNPNDTLKISASNYSTMVSGNDFIVSVGASYVVLKNSASIPVKIKNSAGKLTTYNKNPSYILFGNDYDDVITNTTDNDTVLGYGGNDTLWNYVDGAYIHGGAGNDALIVQGAFNTIEGGVNNDVIILNSSYHNAINYSEGDGNDTVYGFTGTDVVWAYDTFWSTSTLGNDVVLRFQSGSVTLKDVSTIYPRLALNITDKSNGYMTILAGTEIIDASTRKKTIQIMCNELNNEIYGGFGKDSLYGGPGNDTICGNAGNDKLYGENGADILVGGNGNDTLWGGSGNDIFIYTSGKDVIADYAVGDVISFDSSITKATISGSSVVFTTNSGSLTVKNAKDKTLSLIDSSGKSFSTIVGGAKNLSLTNSSSAKITLSSTYTTADASKRTTAIKITGNSKANSIVGGSGKDTLLGGAGADTLSGGKGNDKLYGGTGNDTLIGGAGNDSLWGQGGADTFLYNNGDGKDVIYGFDNTDMLEISGTFSATYNKTTKAVAFKVGSTASAITLKDFTATTFNINGSAYKISGTKLVKK